MPRYAHSPSLSVSRTGRLGSLQLSPFYRRTEDSWDQVRTVDEGGVSTVTWQNLATITSYGGSINASVMQLGAVGGSVSLRRYREVSDTSNPAGGLLGIALPVFRHQQRPRACDLRSEPAGHADLPARPRPAAGENLPDGVLDDRALKQLWGGRGSIDLSVVAPFELQRFTFRTRDRIHVQTGISTLSARRATLGISYNFGRSLQSNRRRSTPEEGERERQIPRNR